MEKEVFITGASREIKEGKGAFWLLPGEALEFVQGHTRISPWVEYDASLTYSAWFQVLKFPHATVAHAEVLHSVAELFGGEPGAGFLPPEMIRRVSILYQSGAKAHAPRNWEKGIPIRSFIDSGLRHFNQFVAWRNDEDHLAAMVWNSLGAIATLIWIEQGKLSEGLLENG